MFGSFSTSTSILHEGRPAGTNRDAGPVGRRRPWRGVSGPCKALHRCCTRTASSPPTPASAGSPGPCTRARRALPIVSPHGHCDPAALAGDTAFESPATELVTKDHYLLRMLYSQGVPLEALGVPPRDGAPVVTDGRQIWRTFASHYGLFRGTPSKLWLDHTLQEVFGVTEPLTAANADAVYDEISARLLQEDFRPRALFEQWGITFLATTDGALDPLESHARLRQSGWAGRVVPTFRPDDVVDPERPGFHAHVADIGRHHGSGHPRLGRLSRRPAQPTRRVRGGGSDRFRPRASVTCHRRSLPSRSRGPLRSDHGGDGSAGRRRAVPRPDARRNGRHEHRRRPDVADPRRRLARSQSDWWPTRFGPDQGADIPRAVDYVGGLKPLLDRFGNEPRLTVIVYTLDETTYSRELAPAGRALPGAPPRASLVVLRQPRGDTPLLPIGRRDGRVRQHGRLQRRRSFAVEHPRPPRRGPAAQCRLPGRPGGGAPDGRSRGRRDGGGPGPQPRLPRLRGRDMRQVVLVGLMGSGKSSVGALVAARTGRAVRRRGHRHRAGNGQDRS